MKRSTDASKYSRFKAGAAQRKQVGGNPTQKLFSGKFTVTKTEKRFEESGAARKNKNYQSKYGSEKQQNLKKIQAVVKPRNEEKIYQTKKKLEYLDNYSYHETKNIKNKDPNKVSKVRHRRKGDIGGKSFDQTTFQNRTTTNPVQSSRLYSSQTSKATISRKNVPPAAKPYKRPLRSNSASKSLTTKSKEVKKFSTNTNLRTAPKKLSIPTAKPSSRPFGKPFTRPTFGGSNSRNSSTTKTITKTTTTKTTTRSNRAQSAGRGRRH